MSERRTPVLASAAVTARTARLARCSAALTEESLVCTPIDSINWSGVPDTTPVPVTVILPPLAPLAPAACTARVRAGTVAAVTGPAWAAPAAKAPISSPAVATPAASARWVGVNGTGMAGLLVGGDDHRFDAPPPLPVPPGSGPAPMRAGLSRAGAGPAQAWWAG